MNLHQIPNRAVPRRLKYRISKKKVLRGGITVKSVHGGLESAVETPPP